MRLLLSLEGHDGAITDLDYSHAGERLLTASQKDGEVRIWSWTTDPAAMPASTAMSPRPAAARAKKASRILLQLKNPSGYFKARGDSRNRANRTSSSVVSCDAAIWTCDDSKVITSQCELVKQTGTDIVPGSQFLFLWDSFNGHCLLGIAGAHTKQCPAIIPHPSDASIFCSAGADGIVKIWDIEAASSFFSFENIVEHGAVERNEDIGKVAGFLDGEFFTDGSGLVLTDDSGRVIVFDCSKIGKKEYTAPGWMKEQYFANDYYDLDYDSNGYCIEHGSQQPPHLAPIGARCAHGGQPFSDLVNHAFKKLTGPLPLDAKIARWQRQRILSSAAAATKKRRAISGRIDEQYDLATTILVRGSECALLPDIDGGKSSGRRISPTAALSSATTGNATNQRLSSNWRWGDYNDLMQETGNEEDEPDFSDDEEFQLEDRRSGRQRSSLGYSDDSEDGLVGNFDGYADSSPERTRAHRSMLEGQSDSEGEFDEFLSTVNHPSGPYLRDYDHHFFKVRGSVIRDWLRRVESNTSYAGRKCYAPQLGDSVVYIPRAHKESVEEHDSPLLEKPWDNFPDGAVWPVVQCQIRHIRYRFPFKGRRRERTGAA